MAGDLADCSDDEEEVDHQLDEEDDKDGYVEVGEDEPVGRAVAEAGRGEVPEEAANIEEDVGEADHDGAGPQGEAETAPGQKHAFP